MKVKKQDWKSHEELAAKIYQQLDPDAIVKHDDSILGQESGSMRQIDVSIRKSIATHEVLVIVQVRRRKRAPDVNTVGELFGVMEDVGASRGVLVCSRPPGKNALRLAKKKRIDICTAVDVSDRKWAEDLLVPLIVQRLEAKLSANYTVICEKEDTGVHIKGRKINFLVSSKEENNPITILEFASIKATEKQLCETGKYTYKFEGLQISTDRINWHRLESLILEFNVIASRKFRYCKPSEYRALKNHSTGELSITDLRVEFPPLVNCNDWQDADSLDLSNIETELVPVLGLSFSQLAQSRVELSVKSA